MTSLGLAVLLLVVAYVCGATAATLRFARRRPGIAPGSPPVSVLKPLHEAEPGLDENLRSFAAQDYPEFQLVFGVRNRNDGALPIARALIGDLPGRDIDLVVDSRVGGSNLKVANLENMLPAARHGLIVMADSDMRVGRDYLRTVTAPLTDPAIGIVTCLYKGVPGPGLWSRLAALHINFGFLPSALVGEALGLGGGCFGATIALRREVLERIGGFARIRDELADDHRLGSAVRGLGLASVLSPYLVENLVSEPSLASLWRHELRWARTSRAMAPAGFAGSVTTHTVVVAGLAAAAWGAGVFWEIVALAMALRWISAAIIARALDLPRTGLWLLPVRDALSFAVFVASFCGRSVLWRGQLFRVEPSGQISVEGDKPA
ncbi:MAG TPA: bacteriohopanetetrol glucosamine biosynthesis glycosyltransferase HpnI [Stellaceae bacterium]|jgi:ceramide glucosyltransferase|nr:bacteriohopanetetrol glucosamine biosynthesis glycosyltransferase HpnI [Stellaceae bacterium]